MLGLLQEEFEDHAEKAKTLPETTSNENKLILYGLFKQATVGPVNTSKHLAQITLHAHFNLLSASVHQKLSFTLHGFCV